MRGVFISHMFIYYLYQGIKKNGTVTQQVKRTLLRFINKCCVSRAKQVSAARHICESTHASCHRLRERAECANTLGSHGFKSIRTKQIRGETTLKRMESRTPKFFNLEQFFSGASKLASCGKETLWLIHCHRVPPQGCDVDPNAIWGGGGDPGESPRAQTLILPRRDKIKGSSFRAARTLRHHVEWRSRVLVV